METAGLVLGIAHAVVQLVGVAKKRVLRYAALHNTTNSIESKTIRSYGTAFRFQKNCQITSFKCSNPEVLISATNSSHLIYFSRASRTLQVIY